MSADDGSIADLQTNVTSARKSLICAVSVAVLWWLALGWLALFTANPVTLNRDQVLRAEYVVTGTISDLTKGTVTVHKEWKHNAALDEITVENLNEAGGKPNTKYLIPLKSNSDHEFRVMPMRLPEETPLIYPATEDAINQLTDLLK